MYAHRASGSLSAQSLRCLATIFVRIFSRTLLVLSTYPFACGWYGEVTLCLIPYFSIRSTIMWDVNYGPPSMTISLGTPKQQNISSKRKSTTTCSVALCNALASTHLVTYFAHTKMWTFCCEGGLNGPTKSRAHFSKGSMTSWAWSGISSE